MDDRKKEKETKCVQADLCWHLAGGKYGGKRETVLQTSARNMRA